MSWRKPQAHTVHVAFDTRLGEQRPASPGQGAAHDRGWDTGWGGDGFLSLCIALVFVLLLLSGEYPQGLFDLVIGLNRRVYRSVPMSR